MDHVVSTSWLEAHLADADLCVVAVPVRQQAGSAAVRAVSEWANAHIPGSRLAELPAWLSGRSTLPAVSPETFVRAMENHGIGAGARVVLYDMGGNVWATRLWWMLHAVGFDGAAVLDGGWHKWQLEGRPESSDIEAPTAAPSTARERRSVFIGHDDVQVALDEPNTVVITTVDAARHSSASLPPAIANYLPGSVNVPYLDTIDAITGGFLPEDEVRRRFGTLLAFERIVTYCGPEGAAASLAFILHSLGHPDVTVYDPSFVDWASERTQSIRATQHVSS